MLLKLLFACLSVVPSHAEHRVDLPVKIIEVLQSEYPLSQGKLIPLKQEMTVTITYKEQVQKIKVGLVQPTLDLASYVDSKWDHFVIRFEEPFPMSAETRLYFINGYNSSGKSSPGLSCGKAVKIQKQLGELFTTQGIKLMTKDAQYLTLLGGDFLLTHLDGQHFRIVYFRIADSRYASRLCKSA